MFENGLLLGITLSFLIGPLLFTIIQASLEDGFKAGFSVAAGMWMSDLIFMGIILFGLEKLSVFHILAAYKEIITISGGIVIFSFGVGSIVASKKASQMAAVLNNESAPAKNIKKESVYFFRGFILNAINPGTIFFWLGLITTAILPNSWSKNDLYLFFSGMLISLISTDLLKIYAAKKLKKILTTHHIFLIQTTIGILLLLFGLGLITKELFLF
jgi:threonine/homoserine/homoserine lactone efflux protein